MAKKILFLIPNLAHGGAERVLVNLVNNMDPDKFEITVQTIFDVGIYQTSLKPHIRYKSCFKKQFRGNNRFFQLFSPEFLWKKLIGEHYDIAVSYLEGPTTRILSGCPDSDTKRVAWLHIELDSPKLASMGFRSPAEAEQAYNSFNAIVAVSRNVRECFLRHLDVHTPVTVLYNTNETEQIVEQAVFEPDDPRFKRDMLSVCSVAKLMKTKGFDRLVNVHKRLLDEGYPHRIYILGIGAEQGFLEQKILEYGVQDTFILLGFKNNPYQYVSRCDLYVCSSRREGFSTAVTEALIVGTPVVSTNCSGAKELLGDNNEYGIVVDNSEDGIYAGMKQMLSDPELLPRYKERAKARGQLFSRQRTTLAVENLMAVIY